MLLLAGQFLHLDKLGHRDQIAAAADNLDLLNIGDTRTVLTRQSEIDIGSLLFRSGVCRSPAFMPSTAIRIVWVICSAETPFIAAFCLSIFKLYFAWLSSTYQSTSTTPSVPVEDTANAVGDLDLPARNSARTLLRRGFARQAGRAGPRLS